MADLDFKWSRKQHEFFYGLKTKYRCFPAGRRVGKTLGAAQYLILDCLKNELKCCWVDTVNSNIDRYVDRLFVPILRNLPPDIWEWRTQRKELRIHKSTIDFASAEKPTSIEGFAVNRMVLNEAGIILAKDRGRYLWHNALLPMTMDYDDCLVFFVGTPKGMSEKNGESALYYDMFQKSLDPKEKKWSAITMATNENPFISREAVEEVRKELPSGSVLEQEFYGRFVQASAGIIRGEWFRVIEHPKLGTRKARGWDMAFSIKQAADYWSGALCSMDTNNDFSVEDIRRGKSTYPEFRQKLIETAWADGKDVPIIIEKAGQQGGYIQDLREREELRGFTILEQQPERDKFTRAMPWVAAAEGGKVFILRGPWNSAFTQEAESFTQDDSHAHDDQIDSVSICYRNLCTGTMETIDNPFSW